MSILADLANMDNVFLGVVVSQISKPSEISRASSTSTPKYLICAAAPNRYTRGDPSEKLEAIEAMVPPHLRKGVFRPPDKLLAMLRSAK